MNKIAKIITKYLAVHLIFLLSVGIVFHLVMPIASAEEPLVYGHCGDAEQSEGSLTPPCCAESNHTANKDKANITVEYSSAIGGGRIMLPAPQYQAVLKRYQTISYKSTTQKTIVLRI